MLTGLGSAERGIVSGVLFGQYFLDWCAEAKKNPSNMPKRKFSEHASGQTTSADESFQHVLDRGQKQLYRALRTASGFESQKLNRRQSGVATGGEQKSRFTAEADILKVCPPLQCLRCYRCNLLLVKVYMANTGTHCRASSSMR